MLIFYTGIFRFLLTTFKNSHGSKFYLLLSRDISKNDLKSDYSGFYDSIADYKIFYKLDIKQNLNETLSVFIIRVDNGGIKLNKNLIYLL